MPAFEYISLLPNLNTLIYLSEIKPSFDTKNTFSEGDINDSSWPYLFINRQESAAKFQDVPERAQAQNVLYQSPSSPALGLGCWKEVYSLTTLVLLCLLRDQSGVLL